MAYIEFLSMQLVAVMNIPVLIAAIFVSAASAIETMILWELGRHLAVVCAGNARFSLCTTLLIITAASLYLAGISVIVRAIPNDYAYVHLLVFYCVVFVVLSTVIFIYLAETLYWVSNWISKWSTFTASKLRAIGARRLPCARNGDERSAKKEKEGDIVNTNGQDGFDEVRYLGDRGRVSGTSQTEFTCQLLSESKTRL
jgi:hypothetical protein